MHKFLYVGATLGELIRTFREDKGLSRTKLADFSGITPNSMVRYELAGTPEGKYPPVKKLVKICEVLEIDPRHVFDAVNFEVFEKEKCENPNSDPAAHDENFCFSEHFRTGDDWMYWKHSTKSIEDLNDVLNMQLRGIEKIQQRIGQIEKSLTENGPDQKDPSRSKNPTNKPKAVDAASINQHEGDDQ